MGKKIVKTVEICGCTHKNNDKIFSNGKKSCQNCGNLWWLCCAHKNNDKKFSMEKKLVKTVEFVDLHTKIMTKFFQWEKK